MKKREYIQANKEWLINKSNEEGVQPLPKGIYYKVLAEGNKSGDTPNARSISLSTILAEQLTARNSTLHVAVFRWHAVSAT